jgi:hypothetical protein
MAKVAQVSNINRNTTPKGHQLDTIYNPKGHHFAALESQLF